MPRRVGDEKQMRAGVADGASPGENSTWAEGPARLGRSLSPASAPVWPDSWEMFPCGGNMPSAARRVPMLELAAQTP